MNRTAGEPRSTSAHAFLLGRLAFAAFPASVQLLGALPRAPRISSTGGAELGRRVARADGGD